MNSNERLTNRQLGFIAIISVASSIALQALGDDAWIYMPPAMFLVIIGAMMWDGRGPLSLKWVLVAAAVSVAAGAFLRIT
jgi:hypothetical protein